MVGEEKIHPTQKPTELYDFCIMYARLKENSKILDTHLGSQSSRIAAHYAGHSFWGYETDKDYFVSGSKRFETSIKQLKFF